MQHNQTLSLILLIIGLLATITTTTTTLAFAQEEEEDEEKEEEESKEEESKDEEEEEQKEEESTEEESSKEEEPESQQQPEEPNTETAPQLLTNFTQPVVNPVEEVSTTQAQPVTPLEEFNATCKCMTINDKPITTTPTTPQQPQQGQQQQIPVTKADIQVNISRGEVIDPTYTNYYTVSNLLDTIINDKSFWSQAGKSSFYIKLDNALDNYQVCSAELNVYQPKSTPYLLDIGVSQNYTGVLDQTTEKIQFDKCVKNMDEIYMIFDNPSGSYVSISEISLFGSKLGETTPTTIIPPTLEPTITPTPQQPQTENATKINIQDSNAEIDIKNSTITFKFDPITGIFKGTQ